MSADIVVLDPEFFRCIDPSVQLKLVSEGHRFAEGPVYFPAHRLLYWSDIPADRVFCHDERTGSVTVVDGGRGRFSNGQTRDLQGRRVVCEHGTRSVVRVEHDGSRTVLADSVGGHRLNSPNDVCVGPDGAVWFTDPTYGIDSDEEGFPAESELTARGVYRLAPSGGDPRLVVDDLQQPNGIAFSPDGRSLYVSDTGATDSESGARSIVRFSFREGEVDERSLFAECDEGIFDGFRFDADGRLWTSAGDGVRCYDRAGTHLGTIRTPEVVGNVEFGGESRDVLYVCATDRLFSIQTRVRGAAMFADAGGTPPSTPRTEEGERHG